MREEGLRFQLCCNKDTSTIEVIACFFIALVLYPLALIFKVTGR